MKRMWILIAAGVLLAALAGTFVFRGEIALALMRRGADQALTFALKDALPDGLHAAFCGTGSPLPDRSRAGPCLAVIADERVFVFDAGEGAAETLNLMGIRTSQIEAVFITHLHSDHFDGLGPLALQHWASGASRAPLVAYGPPGIDRVARGLNEAYAIDSGYRIAHHGDRVVPASGFGIAPRPLTLPDGADSAVVFDDGGVVITAFLVAHEPVVPAYGYRIDYGGRSLVVSGDTRRADAIARASEGADLLVHEALSPELVGLMRDAAANAGQDVSAQIFADIPSYHTTPSEAAELAQAADVRVLALTHLIPPLPIWGLEGPFLGGARSRFDGDLWVMRDGDVISMPSSGGIERRRSLR